MAAGLHELGDKVPRRKVKKWKNLAVLTPDESKPLLYALDPRWRGIVATALFLALRKGEILGMLKEDGGSCGEVTARKVERPASEGKPSKIRPFRVSGRQDLNPVER